MKSILEAQIDELRCAMRQADDESDKAAFDAAERMLEKLENRASEFEALKGAN